MDRVATSQQPESANVAEGEVEARMRRAGTQMLIETTATLDQPTMEPQQQGCELVDDADGMRVDR